MSAGANAAVIAAIAAQELRIRKEIYWLVVNGIRDIDQISAMKKLSTKAAIRYVEKTIREANSYKKKSNRCWSAFVGAYIDQVKNQVVLAASTKELVVITGDYNKAAVTLYSALGWVFLVFGVLFAPVTFGITLVILGGAAAAFFVLLHHTKKTIKRFDTYYDLLHTKKVNAIQEIARITQQSPICVETEIQDLINKMVFVNAKIDKQTGNVMIGELFDLQQTDPPA